MDNNLRIETLKRLYFWNAKKIEDLAIDRAFLDFARTTKVKNKWEEVKRKLAREEFAKKFKKELFKLSELEEINLFNKKHSLICNFIIDNKELL